MKKLRITVDGKAYEVSVELIGGQEGAQPAGPASGAMAAPAADIVAPPTRAPKPAAAGAGGAGDVPSPLAGKVVAVHVTIGQQVHEGENLITLEAMKMNTMVTAPASGAVTAIHVGPGDGVDEGQPLVTVA